MASTGCRTPQRSEEVLEQQCNHAAATVTTPCVRARVFVCVCVCVTLLE